MKIKIKDKKLKDILDRVYMIFYKIGIIEYEEEDK